MKENIKEKYLDLLKTVKREGINELINFLEKSDFFKAPASTRFHGCYEGGLAEHSIKVYEILKHKVEHCIEPINMGKSAILYNRRHNTIWTWRKICNDDNRIYETNTRRKIFN